MNLGLTVALIVAATGYPLLTIVRKSSKKKLLPTRYLLPEGYIGWVRVEYNIDLALPSPIEDGHCVLKIPECGILATSSELEYSRVADDYYYYSDRGRRPLCSNSGDTGSMIWGEAMLVASDAGKAQASKFRNVLCGNTIPVQQTTGESWSARKPETFIHSYSTLRSSAFVNLPFSVTPVLDYGSSRTAISPGVAPGIDVLPPSNCSGAVRPHFVIHLRV
jgi:hypothetical protein